MTKVFIDGSSGTTGLRIYERIEARTDIELIKLPEEKRKDEAARKEALHEADIAFLCLPDEAAREAVKLAEGSFHFFQNKVYYTGALGREIHLPAGA